MIKCSFKKSGFTTNADGSENRLVNIRRLEDYVMLAAEEKFHLETFSSTESEDNNGLMTTMII